MVNSPGLGLEEISNTLNSLNGPQPLDEPRPM